MDYEKLSLELHEQKRGKIEVCSKVEVENRHDLSLAYTPGVAKPCLEIAKNVNDAYKYTSKGNLVAVVSNGTAVLGLGNIGGAASMPVMEGKCVLFKKFGGVDAFPICLNTTDSDMVVEVVKTIAPSFGGINLEDIRAPECFYIERRLKKETDIPIFHDDQHGTAVVTLAGLLNALKLVGKEAENSRVVINGAGAAGIAIAKLLLHSNFGEVILCDRQGSIYEGRQGLNWAKREIAKHSNQEKTTGSLEQVLKGADIFVGVSAANLVSAEMVKSMAADPIVFAQANPVPEISPEEAREGGARIVATGRSDYPNQINNVLAFPGIFRGALDVRASDINEEMKVAAALALAELVDQAELAEDKIIPPPFDLNVCDRVASAVAAAARKTGVARD
ncbi:MAG: NAD-dependent malic enzyme [Firmicutes bacterium]|nr:NAD-dependent malic enzyme [Bacillota bacterium]